MTEREALFEFRWIAFKRESWRHKKSVENAGSTKIVGWNTEMNSKISNEFSFQSNKYSQRKVHLANFIIPTDSNLPTTNINPLTQQLVSSASNPALNLLFCLLHNEYKAQAFGFSHANKISSASS
jgi:hypothetical protein